MLQNYVAISKCQSPSERKKIYGNLMCVKCHFCINFLSRVYFLCSSARLTFIRWRLYGASYAINFYYCLSERRKNGMFLWPFNFHLIWFLNFLPITPASSSLCCPHDWFFSSSFFDNGMSLVREIDRKSCLILLSCELGFFYFDDNDKGKQTFHLKRIEKTFIFFMNLTWIQDLVGIFWKIFDLIYPQPWIRVIMFKRTSLQKIFFFAFCVHI